MDSFRSGRAATGAAVFAEPDQFLGQELQVLHKETGGAQLRVQAGVAAGSYLLQVHVLGQLLLQHVLQLLVHLSQVLVSRLDQISED